LVFGLALIAGAGCARRTDETPPAPPPVTTGGPDAPSAEQLSGSIDIKGSDTMVHLVTAWAEAFMEQHPDVQIAVTGGGSGTGIAAMINGTTDVCAASRQMKDSEKEDAAAQGKEAVEHVVARDGIAVVVNPENPLEEITMEQLAKIFTGACEDWSGVGGPNQPISVLSRESSSGTYAFFREHVMDKQDYTPKAKLMPATSAIIEAAAQDAGSIGYVGLGYVVEAGDKVKALKVKADDASPAVAPSEETVKSGEYGIARPLHLYTAGEPEGVIKAFIDFCLSDEGQQIVVDTGYVAVG
jgi:phosphate transport system substrate-binding protein